MAGLSCGEPSLLAWDVLEEATDALMTVPDHAAEADHALLAEGEAAIAPLVAGESGVAGLAGAIAVSQVETLRTKLAMDQHSRVLVFGTEGRDRSRALRKDRRQERRRGHVGSAHEPRSDHRRRPDGPHRA